jgi:hypothetical protein
LISAFTGRLLRFFLSFLAAAALLLLLGPPLPFGLPPCFGSALNPGWLAVFSISIFSLPMRLRFFFSALALALAVPGAAGVAPVARLLSMRSLRRSSLLFFFGRVD